MCVMMRSYVKYTNNNITTFTFFITITGADPNVRWDTHYQQYCLHAAVRKCNLRAVHYLVDAGASVNVQNARNQTPLMLACDSKIAHSIWIVRYIINHYGIVIIYILNNFFSNI
jgi:ankyrin repeat protein